MTLVFFLQGVREMHSAEVKPFDLMPGSGNGLGAVAEGDGALVAVVGSSVGPAGPGSFAPPTARQQSHLGSVKNCSSSFLDSAGILPQEYRKETEAVAAEGAKEHLLSSGSAGVVG